MVELETVVIGLMGLMVTYLLASVPPRLFRRWWKSMLEPYARIPLPELEDFLPIQAQGFLGSRAVKFTDRVKAYEKMPKRTGVFKERYLWYPTITLCDPRFLGMFEGLDKTRATKNGSSIYGEEALMFLDGERGKRDHARLLKAFGLKDPQDLQKRLYPLMTRSASHYRQACSDSQFENGGFSSEEESLKCALEMFGSIIAGLSLNDDKSLTSQQFIQYCLIGVNHRPVVNSLMKLFNSSTIQSVHTLLHAQVEKRLNSSYEQSHAQVDLLQMLVDFTKREERDAIIEGAPKANWICDQLKGLLLASVLPVTHTMCWSLALLALNPSVQDRIQEELEITCLDDQQSERPPNYDELQELKFLDAFVREVLRLFPPTPYLERIVTAEGRDVDGVAMSPGTEVRFDIMAMHRREDLFSEPNDFRPERWLKDEMKEMRNPLTVNHQAYLPFGIGHRTCLGRHLAVQAIKVMIATLLRSHRIYPLDGKQRLPDAVLTRNVLTCFPGYDVQLISLHDQEAIAAYRRRYGGN